MTRVRIGVTGHRHYNDKDLVASMTAKVLDRILRGGAEPTVVSSLAEGSDRLVADLCLSRPGAQLEVVLPLPPGEYEHDFEQPESRAEFSRLLDVATSVAVVDQVAGEDREAAYERAGRHVVDCADIVLCLWDGEVARGRGGTAELVQYAVDRGVLVEIVLVERAPAT